MTDAAAQGFEAERRAWDESRETVLALLDEVKEAAKAGELAAPTLEEIGLDPSIIPDLSPSLVKSVSPKDVKDAYLFSFALARKFTLNFWEGKGYPFSDDCERLAERFAWYREALAKRRPPVVAWADTLQAFVSACMDFFDGINGIPEFERKDDLLYAWGVSYAYMALYDVAMNAKERHFARELEMAGADAGKATAMLICAGDIFLEDGEAIKAADYMLKAYRRGDVAVRKEVRMRLPQVRELDPDLAATLDGLLRK